MHSDAGEHPDARRVSLHLVDIDDLRTLGHQQVNRLLHPAAQLFHGTARHLHQIQILHHLPREGIEPGGHPIASGVLVLGGVAPVDQRLEHPVYRALVQSRGFRQLVERQPVPCAAQGLHYVKRPVQRLYRSFFFHWNYLRVLYCKTLF